MRIGLAAVALTLLGTVAVPAADSVVVYTALDRQFSEPILREFTAQTGIRVLPVYDTESTKTVGLTNRIIAEANRPRCDVFWNNEILNTVRLQQQGLLQPCHPPQATNYPAEFQDPNGYWFGFAARARVLIVNTERVAREQMPDSIADLADPNWAGKIGIAKPLYGTTATHAACLFAQLGPARARELFDAIKANDVQVEGGNKVCAVKVGAGQLAFALTDTDDAIEEVDSGKPVQIVYPDNTEDGMGVLLLPNTLALVKDCPHPDAGEKLIDYLLSAEVEAKLANGPSAQIPLNKKCDAKSRAVGDVQLHAAPVKFDEAARKWDEARTYIEAHFLTK